MSTEQIHLSGGELNAAVTSALVGIYRKHLGRGPSSASTYQHENAVAVIMHDVMTNAEKSLALSGSEPAVTNMRHLYQKTMEADFKEAIERLSGRRVVAFISGNHVDPDIALEFFMMDGSSEPSTT